MRFHLLLFILFFSLISFSQKNEIDSTHLPKKATILSSILPGSGQVYNNFHRPTDQKNRLWWKLPIIYGGLGTATFFILDNNFQFRSYKSERLYRQETGLIDLYPEYSSDQLKLIQDDYRRWRDLSIISFLGVYLLQLVDANVEGHLIHFDNSNDLSIKLKPIVNPINEYSFAQLKLIITF